MNNKFNTLLLALVLCSCNIIAQEDSNFFVVDTISLDNPVVFNSSKYDGDYLIDEKYLSKELLKHKRIIKNENVYVFSFQFYSFLPKEQLKKYNYPDKGKCSFDVKIYKDQNVYFKKFKKYPAKFILGLIKASYYNKKASTADIGKTYYYKEKGNVYYKILFPLCGNDSD